MSCHPLMFSTGRRNWGQKFQITVCPARTAAKQVLASSSRSRSWETTTMRFLSNTALGSILYSLDHGVLWQAADVAPILLSSFELKECLLSGAINAIYHGFDLWQQLNFTLQKKFSRLNFLSFFGMSYQNFLLPKSVNTKEGKRLDRGLISTFLQLLSLAIRQFIACISASNFKNL